MMDYRSVAVALLLLALVCVALPGLIALAVAWDIIQEQERAINYTASRAETLVAILQTARSGPHAYDPDRPAGLRVTLRKR